MLNIQSNAIKFTMKGYVHIHVKIDQIDNGEMYLVIKVKDSGIGIKEEDKDKLFKLFGFLTDTDHLNTSGIGLGLMISKQIVEKMGGDITFESTIGVGSSFTFRMLIHEREE